MDPNYVRLTTTIFRKEKIKNPRRIIVRRTTDTYMYKDGILGDL